LTDQFLQVQPTTENHWRALCLFGRNVASYKFALGRALLEARDRPSDLVPLEELALPFALAICEHLKNAPKQTTSASSRFIEGCRMFNAGESDKDALRSLAVRLGFNNVIDAFHRLGQTDLDRRFFIDERTTSKSIRLTDHLRSLDEGHQAEDLVLENEARWHLVETAWEMGVSRSLIAFDSASAGLEVVRRGGRVAVTSARSALNGYQKGRCFYCFNSIRIEDKTAAADVDHFIPWVLRGAFRHSLDGVWNLVLACVLCNRGASGKSDFVPDRPLLERLHRRNEFLIGSHHPLRETLLAQTGETEPDRARFLHDCWADAVRARIGLWRPTASRCAEPAF
jgi:hypothetical protein